jgi:hypothetical protein
MGQQGIHQEPLHGVAIRRIGGLAAIRQMCRPLAGSFCHFVNVPRDDASANVRDLHVTFRLDKRGRSARLIVRVNVSPVKGVLK